MCPDELNQATARVHHPQWIIDRHYEWKEVFSCQNDSLRGITCDADNGQIYLQYDHLIERIDCEDAASVAVFPIRQGYPMTYRTGLLTFDPIDRQIVSYSIEGQKASRFSTDEGSWDYPESIPQASELYNHAYAYSEADSSFYFFGGYRQYRYHNRLFRMKAGSNQSRKSIIPRPSLHVFAPPWL